MRFLILLLVLVSCKSGGGSSSTSLVPEGESSFAADSFYFSAPSPAMGLPAIHFSGDCYDANPSYCEIEGFVDIDPNGATERHKTYFVGRLEWDGSRYSGYIQQTGVSCYIQNITASMSQDKTNMLLGNTFPTLPYSLNLYTTSSTDWRTVEPNIPEACYIYGGY